jgi:calcium/calmodulin-dependent protein kinase I
LASSSRKKGKAGNKISQNEDNTDGGGDDGSLEAGEELFGGEGVTPPFNLSSVADGELIDPADLIGSDEDADEDEYYRRNTQSHSNNDSSIGVTSKNSDNMEHLTHQQQMQHQQGDNDDNSQSDYTLPGETTAMSFARRSLITITPQPSSESGMRFDELYRLKGVLGTGAFSTVREGFHRSNGELSYAVKCINRKKLSEEDEAALLDEVAILKEMRHMHIIRLYDFFVEPSTYYLVMERMRGGELFDRVVAKAYYNEKEARDTCKILLEAVGYCHKHHVAHRDLKPENLLLLSEEDDSTVKIADFGFAKKVYEKNCLTTQCGTPGYVAPEILEGTPYDERADMWSVGVILYILLGGYPPFIESTQRDLFRKIRKGEYEFHEGMFIFNLFFFTHFLSTQGLYSRTLPLLPRVEYWGTVSKEAKNLISSLLTVDPESRLTAAGAMEDLWITGDDAKLASNDLGANLKKLQNFNGKRKLRAAVSVILAMNKLHTISTAFAAGGP